MSSPTFTTDEAQPAIGLIGPRPHRGRPRGRGRLSTQSAALLMGGLAAALAYPAYLALYTGYEPYDDEGDWLIGLHAFHGHGSLYHNTWSQAGPFYYQFWSTVLSVFHLGVNLDTGRALTLGIWLATSAVAALTAWFAWRRLSLSLLSQLGVFLLMTALRNEPMDPAGLASLLVMVALLGAVLAERRAPRLGMALVGASLAGAVLTKVNIGVFAVAAAGAAALLSSGEQRRLYKFLTAALGLLFVAPALMYPTIEKSWTLRFLQLEILAVAGIVVVDAALSLSSRGSTRLPGTRPVPGRWAVTSAGAVAVVVTLAALATGTSVPELADGAFFSQRGLGAIFAAPLYVDSEMMRQSEMMLGGAALVALLILAKRRPGFPAALKRSIDGRLLACTVAGGQLFLGLCMLSSVLNGIVLPGLKSAPATPQFQSVIGIAWAGLLGSAWWQEDYRPGFFRLTITLTAVLVTLEAYPVAGSQLWWSTMALVLLAVMLVDDGLRHLFRLQAARAGRPRVWLPTLVPTGLCALLLFGNLGQMVRYYRGVYASAVPTGLRGAAHVRWPANVLDQIRAATASLERNCSTFYSLPGLNSFYLFTGETPPTDLNTTQWFYLMDTATQERIVEALRRTPNLCILTDVQVLPFWQQGKPLPVRTSPLLRYLAGNFVATWSDGDFAIMRPRPAPPMMTKIIATARSPRPSR